MSRDGVDQQRAEFRRNQRVLSRRAGPRRQALQRHRGFRPQLEQVLRVLPHHVEIFLRHADQNQVRERVFGIGILLEDLLIDLRCLVGVTQRLQRHRLAELRVHVTGVDLQAAVETEQRGFRIFLPQVAYAQPQVRVQIPRLQRRRAVERLRRVFPNRGALQAHRQIEPAHRVLRLHLHQDPVALRGIVKIAELELDVTHRAIDLGRSLIGGDRPLKLFERLLPSAGEVESDSPRQMTLRAGRLFAGVDFVRPQALYLLGRSHCCAHFF